MFWDRALPLMERKNISQYQLSKEIGKGKTQVNRWVERGTTPPADYALKIAMILEVQIEYFFPELFPNFENPSEIRNRFQSWVNEMSDDEMETIENLFEALGTVGAGLKK